MGGKAYIFLFQVKKVVDGFIHELWTTRDCHKVWVCSSALGKPEINLEKVDDQDMSKHWILVKFGFLFKTPLCKYIFVSLFSATEGNRVNCSHRAGSSWVYNLAFHLE